MTTATERTPLETAFADLCAKHDLTSLSVSYSTSFNWSANCHWNGFSNDGLTCASSDYAKEHHTPQSAIDSAMMAAARKRQPIIGECPPLGIEQVAA